MADDGVSRDLRPDRVERGPRLRGPHRPDLPPGRRARHRADRLRPARGAQRVPPAHGRRAAPGPRARPDVQRRRAACSSPATARRRRTAAGRSAPAATSGSAAAPATSTPRARPPTTVDPAQARPAAHPRVPAADPVHAEGRDLRGARLGGRRRPQPARGLRPDPRLRASTPASSRPTPTSARSTAASGRRTSPGRSARSSPARSSSSATSTPPRTRTGWAWSTRSSPHADLEREALEWGAQDQRQVADGAADAEVRLQPRSTTAWSASSCSPARRPGWPT